jgi:hypothetical protein
MVGEIQFEMAKWFGSGGSTVKERAQRWIEGCLWGDRIMGGKREKGEGNGLSDRGR